MTSQRVIDLAGSMGERSEWQGFVWNTCADPEGNLFDLMQSHQVGREVESGVFCPDESSMIDTRPPI